MSISVQCPSCGKKLTAKAQLVGKRVKCPSCGQALVVTAGRPPSQPEATNPSVLKSLAPNEADSQATSAQLGPTLATSKPTGEALLDIVEQSGQLDAVGKANLAKIRERMQRPKTAETFEKEKVPPAGSGAVPRQPVSRPHAQDESSQRSPRTISTDTFAGRLLAFVALALFVGLWCFPYLVLHNFGRWPVIAGTAALPCFIVGIGLAPERVWGFCIAFLSLVLLFALSAALLCYEGAYWWALLPAAFAVSCTAYGISEVPDGSSCANVRFQMGCLTHTSDHWSSAPQEGVAAALDALLPTTKYTTWKEHYQVFPSTVAAKRGGESKHTVRCLVCGKDVTLELRGMLFGFGASLTAPDGSSTHKLFGHATLVGYVQPHAPPPIRFLPAWLAAEVAGLFLLAAAIVAVFV